MEAKGRRHTRWGIRGKHRILRFADIVEPLIASVGLRRRALANALAVELTQIDIPLPGLPAPLDGYTIIQLSDLHVGRAPGLMPRAAACLDGLEAELAVVTGDVQTWGTPAAVTAAEEVALLMERLRLRDGAIGILGNHDSHDLVDHLEARGIRVLVNEHLTIERDGARLHLTGTDDVNSFYTEEAARVLRADPNSALSIALVHSPEIADIAAAAGYRLYLAGHTHGGQICLPGGRPVLTALGCHRGFASGQWRCGDMLGYTSRGVGVARRARFNCPPEIAIITLRRG